MTTHQDKHETKVIFRAQRAGDFKDEVTAVFPELLGTNDPYTFQIYAHMGQHGSGDVDWYSKQTRPATPEEYADLKAELERIGYRLKVMHKMQHASISTRRNAIMRG